MDQQYEPSPYCVYCYTGLPDYGGHPYLCDWCANEEAYQESLRVRAERRAEERREAQRKEE